MRLLLRLVVFLAVFLAAAGSVPCTSAFVLSSTDISPPGNQPAGTPMTVELVIDFPWSGNETFPAANELRMSTDLAEARWVPVLVLDGRETALVPAAGSSFSLPGWYLSYPSTQDVQVRVTLTGTIPAIAGARGNLVDIRETDPGTAVLSSSRIALPEPPGETPAAAPAVTVKKTVTRKTYTAIPTDTPAQASPAGTGSWMIALVAAVCIAAWRR